MKNTMRKLYLSTKRCNFASNEIRRKDEKGVNLVCLLVAHIWMPT